MTQLRFLFEAAACLVIIASLLVAARLFWVLALSLRARRSWITAGAAGGLLMLVGLLAAIVAAWFGYGVAHTGKNLRTDLLMLLATAGPFFPIAFGIWLLAGSLQARLRRGLDRPGAQAGN